MVEITMQFNSIQNKVLSIATLAKATWFCIRLASNI